MQVFGCYFEFFVVLLKKLKGLTKNVLSNRLFCFTALNLLNFKFQLLKKNLNTKIHLLHFEYINSVKQPLINFIKSYTKIYFINIFKQKSKNFYLNPLIKINYPFKKLNKQKKKHRYTLKKKLSLNLKTKKNIKNLIKINNQFKNLIKFSILNKKKSKQKIISLKIKQKSNIKSYIYKYIFPQNIRFLLKKPYYLNNLINNCSRIKLFNCYIYKNNNSKYNNKLKYKLLDYKYRYLRKQNTKKKVLKNIKHLINIKSFKLFLKKKVLSFKTLINYIEQKHLCILLKKKKRKKHKFFKYKVHNKLIFNSPFFNYYKLKSNTLLNYIKYGLINYKLISDRLKPKYVFDFYGRNYSTMTTPFNFLKNFSLNRFSLFHIFKKLNSISFLKFVRNIQVIVYNNHYKNKNKQLILLKKNFTNLRKLLKKNLRKINLNQVYFENDLIKLNSKYKNKINIKFLYNQLYKNLLIPWELIIKFSHNAKKKQLGDLFKLHYKIKTKNKRFKYFYKRKSNYKKFNNKKTQSLSKWSINFIKRTKYNNIKKN